MPKPINQITRVAESEFYTTSEIVQVILDKVQNYKRILNPVTGITDKGLRASFERELDILTKLHDLVKDNGVMLRK